MVSVISKELASVDLSPLAQETSIQDVLTALAAELDVSDVTAHTALASLLTRLGQPLLIDSTTPIETTAAIDTTGLSTEATNADILTALQGSLDITGSSVTITGDLTLDKEPASPESGVVNIPAAGTAVQLPDKALKNQLHLQAHPDNTGRVYFGGSAVGNALSAPYVDASSPRTIVEAANSNEWYVNADNDDDKILWAAS